jgi:glucosamine--fructose-6-phosphate aminotransferase (isomerizing)
LEYRGYDSAGISLLKKNGQIQRMRVTGYVSKLVEAFQKEEKMTSVCGIGHTRWATHGAPSEANAHPHSDCSGAFHVVHNGIIENHTELRAFLADGGDHVFSSGTDTEVIAHLLEHFFKKEKNVEKAFFATIQLLKGSFGIVVLSMHSPGVLYVARRSSPILLGVAKEGVYVASDAAPFAGVTEKIVHLLDDQVAIVTKKGVVDVRTLKGMPVPYDVVTLSAANEEHSKGAYAHYMLKEIHEAPEVISAALRGRISPSGTDVVLGGLESIAQQLQQVTRFRIIACGTSYHAALLGKTAFEAIAHIPTEVEIASEFRYRTYVPSAGEVVVAISQSGETADTLAGIRKAKQLGIPTIGIVNVVGSSIAREVDAGLYCYAGPEISVASTKACISQATVCMLIALRFASGQKRAEIITELICLPEKARVLLHDTAEIEAYARAVASKEHMFFIGRGGEAAVSYEAALKAKEVAYMYAEGYPAGELKHGSLALITQDVPTVAFASSNATIAEKLDSNIQEVLARGGQVLLVAPLQAKTSHCTTIYIPRAHEVIQPILHTIVAHLMTYFIGAARKTSIDKPRNLAKAVTVE